MTRTDNTNFDTATKKRAALYLRVSTTGQTVENQRRDLDEAARRSGWTIVAVYQDEGISGSKGRDRRPQFDAMLKAASRREFDIVAAWSVDRLGRSLQDLIGFLGELHAKRIDLYLHQQGIDTATPAGKAMFQMMGVFAEFERAIIVERINAGMARAKAQGTTSGKPIGRPKLSAGREAQVRQLLAAGTGILKTARIVGTGVATVQRIKASINEAATFN